MTTRAAVVDCARRLLVEGPGGGSVPWRHQGRSVNGVDCVGVLIWTAWELGIKDRSWDFKLYRRAPAGQGLRDLLRQHLEPITRFDLREGDIIMMKHINTAWPAHVAIVTPMNGWAGMLHSYVPAGSMHGKVVEQQIDSMWADRFTGFFRFPGLTGG